MNYYYEIKNRKVGNDVISAKCPNWEQIENIVEGNGDEYIMDLVMSVNGKDHNVKFYPNEDLDDGIVSSETLPAIIDAKSIALEFIEDYQDDSYTETATFKAHGKYIPATLYDPPEYPDYEYFCPMCGALMGENLEPDETDRCPDCGCLVKVPDVY